MRNRLAWLAVAAAFFVCADLPAGFGGTDLILPAVARTNGVGGSRFFTTIWVTNPSPTDPVSFQMAFLRGGQPNPNR